MQRKIPFLYASSASTYGSGKHGFREAACEQALNPYTIPSSSSTRFVRRIMPHGKSQIVGFRYFNVFPIPRKTTRTAWLRSSPKYHELREKRGRLPSLERDGSYEMAARSAISSTSTT